MKWEEDLFLLSDPVLSGQAEGLKRMQQKPKFNRRKTSKISSTFGFLNYAGLTPAEQLLDIWEQLNNPTYKPLEFEDEYKGDSQTSTIDRGNSLAAQTEN